MPTVAAVFPNLPVAAAVLARLSAEAAPGARCTLLSALPGAPDGAAWTVRPQLVWPGDRIQNAGEAAAAGALAGTLAAGLLLALPTVVAVALGDGIALSAGPGLLALPALLLAGLVGARLGRRYGLPRDLAHRYTVQLRRGRAVAGVAVAPAQVAAACAFLTQAGAADVRVSRGRLRLRGGGNRPTAAAEAPLGGTTSA